MCTVSILRLPRDVIRLACNRDEQHSRPAALPPQVKRIGRHRAIMPIDPAAGGTWIAANDAGVVMALLNLNPAGPSTAAGNISRGEIIPALIGCSTVADALASSSHLHAADYGPFRLLLIDRDRRAHLISDGRQVRVHRLPSQSRAILFTSSGLGDHVVEPPRQALFDEMTRARGISAATQDAFHRHAWTQRPHLSVCMRRADARTVSHTLVNLRPDKVELRYHPAAPDENATDHCTTFALTDLVTT